MVATGRGASNRLRMASSTPSKRALQIIWPRNGSTTASPRGLFNLIASTPVS